MKHVCLWLFCLFFLPAHLFSQSSDVDSLQKRLAGHPERDTLRANLLLGLAYAYQSTQPDTALAWCARAQSLAEQLGYVRGKALALHRLGNLRWLKAQYPAALDYALQALPLFESVRDRLGMANCYNLMANVYGMERDYPAAIDHYQKSEAIYVAHGDQTGLGRAYANLGRTYYLQGNNAQALAYLQKAAKTLENLPDKVHYTAVLNTLGDVYQKMGDLDQALRHYARSLAISEPLQIKRIITYSTRGISEVYQQQGKIGQSNEYAQRTLEVAKEIGYRENVKNAALILAANYRALGDYQKALDLYTLGTVEKDSMFNLDKERQIEHIRSRYDLAEKQKQLSLLTLEQKVQKQQNNILVLGITVFALLLLLGYYNLRRHQKHRQTLLVQTEQLQQQKEHISATNDHLEETVAKRTHELRQINEDLANQNQNLQQFSYITSHNLRAPVARILGLVNIFNRDNPADPFNQELLSHLYTAAQTLDEVIKDLTNVLSINKTVAVREQVDLAEVIRTEMGHLGAEIAEADARIAVDLAAVDKVLAIRVYVHSIVHNLLSNAVKYRSGDRDLEIDVRTSLADGFACLSVRDNGLGIDSPDPYKIFGLYQRMHTHVDGKGLGLYLVRTQVEAMNGRIEVTSQLHIGTEFRVYLPLSGL
jgi:signal transduction histidine kinase/tetratricopeptide (TPR) repeat protein